MNLFMSLAGMIQAELTSADLGKTLDVAAERGILLYDLHVSGPLSASFRISRRDCGRLRKLADQRGDQMKILRRVGVYWIGRGLLHRPVLLIGILLVISFFLFLPTRIFFIEVAGNQRVPGEQIRQAAVENGLRFGVSRRKLRSQSVTNGMLRDIPELSWIGINSAGCVARVLVEEKQPFCREEKKTPIYAIVAARDGIIDSCTAARGNLLCAPGQAVSKGQLLISGYVNAGSHLRAMGAEGEVFGRTRWELTAITPAQKTVRREKTGQVRKFGLVIGKNRINFPWNSGIPDASCGRMYEEYCITLPGGYRLPVLLTVDRYTVYDTAATELWEPEAELLLESGTSQYLQNQMIAGTILDSSTVCARGDGILQQNGTYLCREMLGRRRQEKIGE